MNISAFYFYNFRRQGPDAAQLRRQNHHLKEQLDRCMRENAILKGFQMRSKNSVFKRIQSKENCAVDDQKCIEHRRLRPHSTLSCPPTRLAYVSHEQLNMRSKSARVHTLVKCSPIN